MQNTEQPIRSREIEILRAIERENSRWSEYGRYIKKREKKSCLSRNSKVSTLDIQIKHAIGIKGSQF